MRKEERMAKEISEQLGSKKYSRYCSLYDETAINASG